MWRNAKRQKISLRKIRIAPQQLSFIIVPMAVHILVLFVLLFVTETAKASEVIVEGPAMVFVSPPPGTTSKGGGDDGDFAHYLSVALELARKNGLKDLDTSAKRIVFKKKSGSTKVIKNNATDPSGAIYLFDGVNNPKEAKDITVIDEEYKAYFGKTPK